MSSKSFAVPVSFPGGPEFVAALEHKREIVTDLCETLLEYLTHDLDLMIEQVNRKPPRPPRPTIEDLNKAQANLDLIERQMDGIEAYLGTLPNEMNDIIRTTQMPVMEHHRDELRHLVSMIQQAMEQPEPDPSSPWDGSHRISTLCAICARPYEDFAKSMPELKQKLKDAGWGRDADGDHICPTCVAASKEQEGDDQR